MTHETSIIQRSEQSCLLSVIIPVYNVAPYVGKTLESVVSAVRRLRASEVAERLPSLSVEVICVDDGSADGSGEILDAWAASVVSTDLSLKPIIIHQANVGVSAARNAALDIATGEWVMMLDGDDTWEVDLLAKVFGEIDRHPYCDAVGFGVIMVNESGVRTGELGAVDALPTVMTGDEVLLDGRGPYSKFIWSSCDKIYRRSVIEGIPLRYKVGMRLSEDSLFAQTFLAYAKAVVLRPDLDGYRYLMRTSSAIHIKEAKLPSDPLYAFRALYGHWKRLKTPGLCRRLYLVAVAVPSLGKDPIYEPQVRDEAIEFLLDAPEFARDVLKFLLWHGSFKSGVFAIVCKLSPRWVRKKILQLR